MVDAIGSALSVTNSDAGQTTLTQADFIKLFMTELSFQDPLEPINNREFLAQMAQFANLEQARVANENTTNLVSMNATSQSLGILGKSVELMDQSGASIVGSVSAVSFSQAGPVLTIKKTDGSVVTDVKLAQINLVRQ